MQISNSPHRITANFRMNEFYSGSPDAPQEHFLAADLIDVAQYLRDRTGKPVVITSSFRTPLHNAAIGGASKSYHLTGQAIDLKLSSSTLDFGNSSHDEFIQDILAKGDIYSTITSMGIGGIGLYDTFIHLDTRDVDTPVVFDRRVKKKGKIDLLNLLKGENKGYLYLIGLICFLIKKGRN